MSAPRRIRVDDPEGATHDPVMRHLARALDPDRASRAIATACPALGEHPALTTIEVMRYRPRRRCLIRYGLAGRALGLVGKAVVKGVHERSLAVQKHLFRQGFDACARDRIGVPEPLAPVPELGLWLQREVAGRPLQAMLWAPAARPAMRRAGAALAKLHAVEPGRAPRWTIRDELAVLETRLERLAACRPELAARVRRLARQCLEAAAGLPSVRPRGIHRDFYPEQVLIADERLHLLDFDLFALGDPALDAGNFTAHLLEAAIRETGSAAAASPLIDRFLAAFFRASPATGPRAVAIYTLLSLTRLVQISTEIAGREHATEALLAHAERLARMGERQPDDQPAEWLCRR